MSKQISPVEDIFRRLLPERISNYEKRQQQIELALRVERTLLHETSLLAEAGTGTGKSYAYLIPLAQALLAGSDSDLRAVVSTATIALQEQLLAKDIPFLEEALDCSFQARLAKGKGNYLCLLRCQEELQQQSLHEDQQRRQIREWAGQTETGDKADLPFEPGALWHELCPDDSCPGRKCSLYERCFFVRARARLAQARLIVCNHALFFTDLNIRSCSDGHACLLPDYRTVVFDEAQHVEATARETMSREVSSMRLPVLLFQLRKREGCNLEAVQKALLANDRFFAEVARLHAGDKFVLSHDAELTDLGDRLREAVKLVGASFDSDLLGEREYALVRSLGNYNYDLDEVLAADDLNQVFWGEQRSSRGRLFITLHATPLDISEQLGALLFDNDDLGSVVLTSATLSAGGNFSYLKQAIGCSRAEEAVFPSPFDFGSQCLLYLPPGLPDPRQPEFYQAAARVIEDLLCQTEGRAFVLFTSYKGMNEVYEQLADGLPWRCLKQGDLPRQLLLESFKADLHSVLFATSSFWEGVDVQGEALSCVVLVKLPFAVPDDPITEARIRAIEEQGENPFLSYTLPEAIIRLKQGFGRLIRTREDRGVVAILDPRIRSKWYGRRFLSALPGCSQAERAEEVGEWLHNLSGAGDARRTANRGIVIGDGCSPSPTEAG